ncbi:response regulator [Chloroflexia bacterium SDU3-3]|nr:response regulator [Chloroflexia bacterium SDU3-3]
MRDPGHTIMLIEQDEATRELYRRAISQEYAVVACEDDRQARELLCGQPIHAIILEPVWADGGGWDLLAAIRRAAPRPPVILCSTLDERRRGLALGASAYLIKPVLPADLLAAVRRVLAAEVNQ